MSNDAYDLIISDGTVVNHAGRAQSDIAIRVSPPSTICTVLRPPDVSTRAV